MSLGLTDGHGRAQVFLGKRHPLCNCVLHFPNLCVSIHVLAVLALEGCVKHVGRDLISPMVLPHWLPELLPHPIVLVREDCVATSSSRRQKEEQRRIVANHPVFLPALRNLQKTLRKPPELHSLMRYVKACVDVLFNRL